MDLWENFVDSFFDLSKMKITEAPFFKAPLAEKSLLKYQNVVTRQETHLFVLLFVFGFAGVSASGIGRSISFLSRVGRSISFLS